MPVSVENRPHAVAEVPSGQSRCCGTRRDRPALRVHDPAMRMPVLFRVQSPYRAEVLVGQSGVRDAQKPETRESATHVVC
jgi:hypothetical protein